MKKHTRGNKKVEIAQKRKNVYQFMVHAAKTFQKDTDFWNMLFCHNGYSMKFVADKVNYGIYEIYGCDDEGKLYSKQPIFIGNTDEIVEYLNDESNIDNVLSLVSEDF